MLETICAFEKKYGRLEHHDGAQYLWGAELGALVQLARRRPNGRIMEIGTNVGHTTRVLSNWARVWTFDIDRADADATSPFVAEVPAREMVGRECRSRRVVSIVDHPDRLPARQRESAPYDLIFIDGDHREACVRRDTRTAFECVGEGGIVAWDDYTTCDGVKRIVDHLNGNSDDRIALIVGTRICYATVDEAYRQRALKNI